MTAISNQLDVVRVVHQYGLGIHDTDADVDFFDPAWQQEQYARFLDFAVEAEELGFDGLTMTEHHVPGISNPSPHLLLSHAAARTNRITLGTAITVLPLYQPVRVAEEAAMLNLLSGGRFELGLGRGNPTEYEKVTGRPASESEAHFREAGSILALALTGDEFAFEGDFHNIPQPVVVTPSPLNIPVWMAAQGLSSVEFAARQGWGLLRNFGDNATHRAAFEHYKSAAADAHFERSGSDFMLSQFVCIGATSAEAEASKERLLAIFNGVARPTGPAALETAPQPPIVCGTPQEVLAALRNTMQETGARRLMIEAITIEETRLFAREVLPALQSIEV